MEFMDFSVQRLIRLYIGFIFAAILVLAALTMPLSTPSVGHWKVFFMLLALSMATQVVSSAMPSRDFRIPHIILFFTGVLLLPPILFSTLIVSTLLVSWEHDRREGKPIVRDKYRLPLRIGTHLLAAFCAYWTLEFTLISPVWVLGFGQLLSILAASFCYALLHHTIGRGVNLVRGLDLRESGLLDLDSVFSRIVMLLMGYGVAILWLANPWLLLVGIIPGLYYYHVHVIPTLKAEAYTDAKTGLSNMRHFDELFRSELTRASQRNQPISMIMVDIDDLGKINNSYGHLTGDSALQTVSGTIRHQINAKDIAARLGGEEFAVVLPETPHQEALEFARLLREQIEAAKFDAVNQTGQLNTTTSIGVASFPQHGLTTLEIIHAADVAMYQAKMMGKNRVISAEEVSESLLPELGHQESTEVINYRAAFSSSANATELVSIDSVHADSGRVESANRADMDADAVDAAQISAHNTREFQGYAGSSASNELPAAQSSEPATVVSERTLSAAVSVTQSHRSVLSNGETVAVSSRTDVVNHRSLSIGQVPQEYATSHLNKQTEETQQNVLSNGRWSSMALNGLFTSGRFSAGGLKSSAANNMQHESTTELIHALSMPEETEQQSNRLSQIPLVPVLLTVCCGIASTVAGLIANNNEMNLLALLVFGIVALIVQLLQYSMYESSTISVSAAIILAATLVEGMPGLLTTCTAVVLVHSIQYQPALHKVAFNWSTHILAGMPPFLVYQMGITNTESGVRNLPLLVLLTLMSALAYYAIESGFVAYAVGRATSTDIIRVWNSHFRWLLVHYIVAGFVALSMALAYMALGPWGVVAFAMPVLLIYFAQKQYVLRTAHSTKQLNRMNSRLLKANNDITRTNQAFHRLTDELFMILSKIIDARDPDVHGHASQVSTYAQAIGQELGLKQDDIEQLRRGALLHDIGKLGIPESILHKPGPLTDHEYEIMKTHAALGADLLSTCHDLRELEPYVRHHHEWWNGKGYPSALYQDQIPLGARIIAVCDAVEAMASDRPYRRGLGHEEIITELKNGKGIQFDPIVVDAFTEILEQQGNDMLKNTATHAVR